MRGFLFFVAGLALVGVALTMAVIGASTVFNATAGAWYYSVVMVLFVLGGFTMAYVVIKGMRK